MMKQSSFNGFYDLPTNLRIKVRMSSLAENLAVFDSN